MHKSVMKCNKTLSKWCKNKHEASKITDTFETYQLGAPRRASLARGSGITRAARVEEVRRCVESELLAGNGGEAQRREGSRWGKQQRWARGSASSRQAAARVQGTVGGSAWSAARGVLAQQLTVPGRQMHADVAGEWSGLGPLGPDLGSKGSVNARQSARSGLTSLRSAGWHRWWCAAVLVGLEVVVEQRLLGNAGSWWTTGIWLRGQGAAAMAVWATRLAAPIRQVVWAVCGYGRKSSQP
jgi:hypothetical protein